MEGGNSKSAEVNPHVDDYETGQKHEDLHNFAPDAIRSTTDSLRPREKLPPNEVAEWVGDLASIELRSIGKHPYWRQYAGVDEYVMPFR